MHLQEGRRATAFLLCAVALAAIVLVLASPHSASATGDSMLGIDMSPGTGVSAAGIATCAQVQPGDSFEADVFVSNALNLVQWELRVDFNPDVVSLESADYGYFLTASGGGIMGPLFDSESAGRRFLAAAEPKYADTGSGVLARLHLVARAEGISPLSITSSPTIYGPRLVSAGSKPFADFNGDSIFDGALSGASVAVGMSCGASTPVVTPSPAPTLQMTPTPKPGATVKTPAPRPRSSGAPGTTATEPPGNGGSGSNEGDSTPRSGGDEPTPRPSEFVIDAPGGQSDGEDGDSNGSSSNEGTSPDSPSNGDGATQSSGDGSGSTTLILVIVGAFAALCLLLGASFLIRGRLKQ